MSNLVSPGQPSTPQDGPEGERVPDGAQEQPEPITSVVQPPVAPPPPTPVRSRRTGRIITWAVFAVVIAVGVGWKVHTSLSSPSRAGVGDCLSGTVTDSETVKAANDFKTIACTSSDAKYKVLGKIDNKTEAEFEGDRTICAAYPDTMGELWGQSSGKNGYVLCLGGVH